MKTCGALVITVACLSAVTACSSSGGGGGDSSGATGGAGSGSAKTSDTIVIGNVGSYSGAQAANIGPTQGVIKAFVDQANAAGGINGHKIKLISKDVGDSASAGLLAVKEMVQKDHVVAIVGDSDLADSNWEKYIESTDVPVIGGIPLEAPFLKSPSFFSSGANVVALYYGIQQVSKAASGKMGVLYCAESPVCAQVDGLNKAISSKTGVSIAASAKVAGSSPDYTSVCQTLKKAGVDGYATALGGPIVLRVAADCAKQGFKGKPIVVDGSTDQTWLKSPGVDGVSIVGLTFPYFDSSSPATKAYQQFRAKAGLSAATSNANGSYVYTAAKLFEKAVMGVSGKVTPASLKASLYTMKNETLGGLTGPLTFTKGRPSTAQCYFNYKISGGKFVTPNGLKTTCVPDADMAAILKLLAT